MIGVDAMSKNQLQKDINEIIGFLERKGFIYTSEFDALTRLKWYQKQDLGYETYTWTGKDIEEQVEQINCKCSNYEPYNQTSFQRFCQLNDYIEFIREDCEKEVKKFIDETYPQIEYYVECEDSNLLSIMVCGDIDREKFEKLVIKGLCEQYNTRISYVETVENDAPYIEWGLILKDDNNNSIEG